MTTANPVTPKPWYREPWPWLLMAGPAIVVVAGFLTLGFAIQSADGLVADATLLYEAWPFDMTKVTRPVHFWQGSDDTLVPEVINKTVADKTPGAVWHPISGGGHFIAISHANEILEVAANDLAVESH